MPNKVDGVVQTMPFFRVGTIGLSALINFSYLVYKFREKYRSMHFFMENLQIYLHISDL